MKKLGVLSLIFVIAIAITFLISVKAEIQSSLLKQFNITPEILRLNWTNDYSGNITLKSNATSQEWVLIQILNDTSGLSENYTQGNTLTECQNVKLIVRNTTHTTGNYQNVSNGTNVDVRLVHTNFLCKPGRYSTATFTFRNSTQINETANATIYLDLPIATSNTLSSTTGIGSFGGNVVANATEFHSYFFDTSNITNATSVVINMSGWTSSQDIDLFLFDNSSTPLLQAKSINKTATNEYLIFNYLPTTGKMWEIRIYGNSSTSTIAYNGNILFSGLNATNTSNNNQQFGFVDLGIKNASTVTNFNITLRNEFNLTHSSVVEEKEIFYIRRFTGSGVNNFSVIVPDSSIANKVAVGLNWTGGSNYSFNVINTSGAIVITSPVGGAYRLANVSGANQELWNETTNVGSVAGAWIIQVVNNTNDTVTYTATAYIYVTTSSWIASNYSSMTFNRTGNANFTRDVSINFTVPNNTLDGFYEGSIKYRDSNKAGISIPFKVNVTAPVLVVNGTLNSKTITIDENIGANLTRTLFFELNNSGSIDAITTFLNSSDRLSCLSGSCSGYNGSLTFNTTSSLGKSSSQLIRVQISYNSSMPSGVYEGWLYINATNETVALSSHPYSSFNATIRLNLTNNLTVNMLEMRSLLGNIMTRNNSAENVTIRFRMNYINTTEIIEAQSILNTSNFSVWLVSKNVSSFRVPTTGSLTLFNGTNPIYLGGDYEINATIPNDTTGGFYEVHVLGNYTKNPTYSGEGVNSTFIVNNTGLLMSSNVSGCSFGSSCSASISIANASTTTVHINVSNFGNLAASSVTLTYSESCVGYSLSNPSATSGCSAGTLSGSTATISPGANSTSCVVSWTVTANNTANSACTGTISGSPASKWYNPNGVNISIEVTAAGGAGTGTGTGTGAGAGGNATTTTTTTAAGAAAVYLEFSSYPTTVEVEQGGNKTVDVIVKNINNSVAQSVTLSISDIDSSWYSIDPSTAIAIKANNSYTYKVAFSIPSNAEVKDYAGSFKASSNYTDLTQSFTLRITPGSQLKTEIDASITEWETKITKLEADINATKSSGLNTTEIEAKLADLKSKFEQAKSSRDAGDYRTAFDLLSQIETLYNEISTSLAELKAQRGPSLFSYLKWALLFVAVVFAAVLAYLFWPTKVGYTPKEGYKPTDKKKEEVKDKIEDQYQKLKEKWKNLKKKD